MLRDFKFAKLPDETIVIVDPAKRRIVDIVSKARHALIGSARDRPRPAEHTRVNRTEFRSDTAWTPRAVLVGFRLGHSRSSKGAR